MNSPSVYIIILNYNGHKDTIECVKSLANIQYDNFKVVIVDNNSTDKSEEIIRTHFPYIKIIQTGHNLGYAAGNNCGIEYAIKSGAEYICILNNDTIAVEDFLSPLIHYLSSNNQPTIIGPMILEQDNHTVQSTGAIIDLFRGRVPVINNGKFKEEISDEIIKCDYIGGACLVFSSDVVNNIGLLPENYFLFYEETEWCLKAKLQGFDIICDPNISIVHKGSVSINKVSGLIAYLVSRNRVVFMRRNTNMFNFIIFIVYLFMETIYKVIVGKKSFKTFGYYSDGLFNKVKKEYNFIHIV